MAKKIFVIAGEASGDALGANLMRALKAQSKEPIEFRGIGGPKMEAEGLDSLLPMEDLCVMGIWEVIWQLPRLINIVKGLVSEIEDYNPDAVVTIDLPDLNFQVASRVAKSNKTNPKLIHYVAPSVWAWRPKRADRIANFLDGVMCLLPFEPKYFLKLRADYVGHPIIEIAHEGDGDKFREARGIPKDVKTLGVFFGSRTAEVKANRDVLKGVASLVHEIHPNLHLIVPTLPGLEYEVLKICDELEMPSQTVTDIDAKWDAFAACDVAVAVSGTVGLELAFAKVPHVIVYKTHPMTWAVMKALVKSQYAHLVNIVLGRPVIPEYLQGKADAVNVGKAVLRLYKSEEARKAQADAAQELRKALGSDDPRTPSVRAADFVLGMIEGRIKTGVSPEQIKAAREKPKPKPQPKAQGQQAKPTQGKPAAKPAANNAGEKKPFQEIYDLVDKAKALIPKKK
jgi:lipid-A-disaccharide synthase